MLYFHCGDLIKMTGEMYDKALHLFWQDIISLDVCLGPKKCVAEDEFGKAGSQKTGILDQFIPPYFLGAWIVTG